MVSTVENDWVHHRQTAALKLLSKCKTSKEKRRVHKNPNGMCNWPCIHMFWSVCFTPKWWYPPPPDSACTFTALAVLSIVRGSFGRQGWYFCRVFSRLLTCIWGMLHGKAQSASSSARFSSSGCSASELSAELQLQVSTWRNASHLRGR